MKHWKFERGTLTDDQLLEGRLCMVQSSPPLSVLDLEYRCPPSADGGPLPRLWLCSVPAALVQGSELEALFYRPLVRMLAEWIEKETGELPTWARGDA